MDGSSQVLSLFKRQGHEISTLHRAPLLVSRPNSSPLRSLEKKTWPRGKQSNKESTCQYHQYYGSVEIWKQKPIGLKLSVSADTQVHCSPATLNFLSCPTLPTPTNAYSKKVLVVCGNFFLVPTCSYAYKDCVAIALRSCWKLQLCLGDCR